MFGLHYGMQSFFCAHDRKSPDESMTGCLYLIPAIAAGHIQKYTKYTK